MPSLADRSSTWSSVWEPDQRASPIQSLVSFATALLVVYFAAAFGDYKSIPDWTGYERLYISDGGWLYESGRDPVFTSLLSLSLRVFGSNGYEIFRSSLVLYFVLIIGFLCWTVPRQTKLSGAGSALLIGLIAAAMFTTKALVQIREGLAFTALMFAVILTIKSHWRYLPLVVLFLSILAVLTHSGLAIPAIVLIGSWLLVGMVNDDKQINHKFYRITVVSCGIFGLTMALLMIRNPDVARQYFEGFVSDRSDIDSAGLGKYIYWVAMCASCYIIHRQSLTIDETGLSKFGVACIYAFGSILLPICFAIAFGLILFRFPDGTVIASFVRLLFTAMSLVSLIVIILRGARMPLFAVCAFILIDQVRIMIDNYA